MEIEQLWKEALKYIKNEINEVGYNTWIQSITPVSYEHGIVTLSVRYNINKEIVSTRYRPLIENSLFMVTRQPTAIDIIVDDSQSLEVDLDVIDPAIAFARHEEKQKNKFKSNLNSKYTFENFVVGNSNRYVHAVAHGIAESPSTNYNPLFLYGSSGLGKTHLMHAIGNEILRRNPDYKILYISSERFTNDLINSLREDKMESFRERYRNLDVLLVDDVQFIEGKESTQEEFFHTFNALYEANKQIVLTSDRKPKELITLEERLRTRFECGIIGDISFPDYETRIAILKMKAENQNIYIREEVFEYVAERIRSNVRELEGALLKIVSFSNISGRQIDLELADEALRAILPSDGIIKITSSAIREKVCKYYGLTNAQITGAARTKELVLARQVAMYLCKTLTDMSNKGIGREFGNRDHTSKNNERS